jgi:UDP-2,3-diacylglucosamine pyrophosphatase LpxH
MEIIKCSLPSDYELVVSSDLHLGAGTVSEEPIEQMVEYVRSTKNCYMTNIGDNIEAITPKDKRFTFSKSPYKTAQEQADAVIRLFTPIKDKTLAIGIGNHEYSLFETLNVAEYIAKALDVPNGMYNYILQVHHRKSSRLMHKMYLTHGNGIISSNAKDEIQAEGNMKAALKNKLNKSGFADVIAMFMGHIHRFIIVEPTMNNKLYLTTEDDKMKQHYRHLEKQNSFITYF